MAHVAQVPHARSVESPPRPKTNLKTINYQSEWNPHDTKMADVAQVPRARSVESPQSSKKHNKSISRANGIYIALKWPMLLKYRARAVLRARPAQQKYKKSISRTNGIHIAQKWPMLLKYRARAQC
jgi:hypothetical protein